MLKLGVQVWISGFTILPYHFFHVLFDHTKKGLVTVPIKHHPNIGDSSPTDIWTGCDAQNPPKRDQKGTFTSPCTNKGKCHGF